MYANTISDNGTLKIMIDHQCLKTNNPLQNSRKSSKLVPKQEQKGVEGNASSTRNDKVTEGKRQGVGNVPQKANIVSRSKRGNSAVGSLIGKG